MSLTPRTQAFVTWARRHLRSALLVTLGLVIGIGAAWLWPKATVTPERLTGTVTWSNQDTHSILFEADGGAAGKTQQYAVVGDDWTDVTGIDHSGGYPDCLSAQRSDTVRTDRRHVELGAIYPTLDDGVGQIAVSVQCLS
jgi:hypothetical protein